MKKMNKFFLSTQNIENNIKKVEGRVSMKVLDIIALIIVIIGAINWGLIGFFNFNLVSAIFGYSMCCVLVFLTVFFNLLYFL